ncbi:MAG: hypothetical protein IPG17_24660, partial [Sandaracinaceae bacterium]|nr:hypothetical protein [Sandaracinaceae bacterium]
IVAAWVERAGADPRRVGLRTEAPLTFDWVELRGVPMLARLEAADAELPQAAAGLSGGHSGVAVPCACRRVGPVAPAATQRLSQRGRGARGDSRA